MALREDEFEREAVRQAPLDPELAPLNAAVQALSNRPRLHHEPGRFAVQMVQLRRLMDQLELSFSEMAGKFAGSDEYEAQGSVSPIDWIRHHCQMGSRAAADRVCVGEQLPSLSQSVASMEQGRVGFQHLTLIARMADCVDRSPTALVFHEAHLLEQAEGMSVGKFRYACYHARHALDPEGVVRDEVDQVLSRELTLQEGQDGMYFLNGRLDAEGGATLRTALEPLARKHGTDDERRRERRWADALIELCNHALDDGTLPRQGGQRPHLMLTSTIETLIGLFGSPGADMDFSRPISVEALRRHTCDCSVTRVLLSGKSVPIDVGRAWRTISPSQRRALHARDQHCQWPGCDRPASWCQAHHKKHWSRGGTSDIDNYILVCNHHHWKLHEGGWELIETGDGRMLAIPGVRDWYYWARGPTKKVAA
jgi:hypothetical protein